MALYQFDTSYTLPLYWLSSSLASYPLSELRAGGIAFIVSNIYLTWTEIWTDISQTRPTALSISSLLA